MTVRAYQRQHLAAVAAGYINGAGTTRIGIGCALTRISTGVYDLILPADAGLIDRETFTFVTVKGTEARSKAVSDVNNFSKRVTLFNTDITPGAADADVEIILFRPVNGP